MRSPRFLLSRRWALFALTIVFAAWATWWLGNWQFRRLDESKAKNATIRANENATPVDVSTILSPGQKVTGPLEYRRVIATGTYDPSRTVVVRYRTYDSETGIDIVVPLRLANGQWLLVDRGWMATGGTATVPTLPAPPVGQVTVTGYLREDGSGASTNVDNRSVRAISSVKIAPVLGIPVYGGFLEAGSESPAAATQLRHNQLPDLSNGVHFFYAIQWWFFGVLAIFGFFYLMYDEWRGGLKDRGASRRRPAASRRSGTTQQD